MPNPETREEWDAFLAQLRAGDGDYEARRNTRGLRAFFDRLLGFGNGSRAQRLEVDADQLLAAELVRLSALDPRWGFMQMARTENGLVVPQHMVVGPGGVFLLSAKNHPGARLFVEGDVFRVNGKDRPYIATSRQNASRAMDLMNRDSGFDLGVTGVIVPVKDRRLVVQQAPDDVAVIERDGLAEWLLDRPEELSEHRVIISYSIASEATGWGERAAA
ncbi:NERD domain-containing protein [Propionibacterium australiense]|uniref:NERD domain-containing protein n=2 Tax=Propionibacterium australiense TaxID=119981 RepID=A0A8B3FM13_9ACTN|nr:NERD domain-containing protein [Propionibacterium australiense]RLP13008.1 NERD domain-containing protein [Propionibacterium australiense]